jgi:hypothetical protein
VRAVVGYERLRALEHGCVAEGIASYNGVDGDYRLAFTADGRFLSKVTGPLGETSGFDGAKGWAVDWSGLPRPLELEDLEEEQLAAWVYTGRWLAEGGPFAVSVDRKGTSARQVALAIRLGDGPLEATLFVDRSSWLPSSLVRRSDSGEEVYRFEDYREAEGFLFPFRFTRSVGKVEDRFEVRSLRAAGAGEAASLYDPPSTRPKDTRFRPGVPAAIEARRTRSGHILVRPSVDGKDVGWFVLDSGAGAMVVDRAAADKAGMAALGRVHVNGVGGSETGRFRTGTTLELGPVTIDALRYVELDLTFLSQVFGVTIGGIVGYDLFARVVVEFDVAAPAVRLHDPATYRLAAGRWQQILFSHKHPAIRARFEGDREGVFRLDTGSDDTVTFHAPAVERFALLEGRKTAPMRSGGVGGASPGRTGTLEWFELGGRRFEKPTVGFATAREGAFADDYTVGNIGTGLLSAFVLVFDYPSGRLAFVPR